MIKLLRTNWANYAKIVRSKLRPKYWSGAVYEVKYNTQIKLEGAIYIDTYEELIQELRKRI